MTDRSRLGSDPGIVDGVLGRRRDDRGRAAGEAFIEIDCLFNPGRKYVKERQDYVATAKQDDRESGAGPLDLDSGVVRIRPPGS